MEKGKAQKTGSTSKLESMFSDGSKHGRDPLQLCKLLDAVFEPEGRDLWWYYSQLGNLPPFVTS